LTDSPADKITITGLCAHCDQNTFKLLSQLISAEQDRPDVAAARKAWRRKQRLLNSTRLVFIDETAATTSMTRFCGRGPRGERLVCKVPPGHWKTMSS
jgi:hypothetical protein